MFAIAVAIVSIFSWIGQTFLDDYTDENSNHDELLKEIVSNVMMLAKPVLAADLTDVTNAKKISLS